MNSTGMIPIIYGKINPYPTPNDLQSNRASSLSFAPIEGWGDNGLSLSKMPPSYVIYSQTLRLFQISYFKYVFQISFNLFQFISSKFWKTVIFNLFEVCFSNFRWNKFWNKFFSDITIITSIITYFEICQLYIFKLFFILSGKWFHDFWCWLFWDFAIIYLSLFFFYFKQ